MQYDIFISYKRKSQYTANDLHYRLATRGYSTFFDQEEMRSGNFNVQLLQYIENAKDVFIILEEGSLDGCKREDWEKDWFLFEVSYALEKGKNIIPILLNGFQMPDEDFFPNKLKELRLKHAPEFSLAFFDAYLKKLEDKGFITAKPRTSNQPTSVFKFFSNENCQVFHDGKLVCAIEGMADEAFYLPVNRKGDFRFKAVNSITGQAKRITQRIDADEEKIIDIEWEFHRDPIEQSGDVITDFIRKAEESGEVQVIKLDKKEIFGDKDNVIVGDNLTVDVGGLKFNMIRVEVGEMMIGATAEQGEEAESNEFPAHQVSLPTFYIGQFPITQNIWELVMGYNKSHFKYKEDELNQELKNEISTASAGHGIYSSALIGAGLLMGGLGSVSATSSAGKKLAALRAATPQSFKDKLKEKLSEYIKIEEILDECGHYPVENISYDEAQEFVRRLSAITNLQFSLPTEDEWEYAARGGNKSMKYKYAGSNDLSEVAWYAENADGTTHPVGEKKPNELRLYDMSGNVWEWTQTPAHSFAMQLVRELLLDESTTFIRRGGSWFHEATNCRVARRYASDHTKKTSGLGLRVVIRENVE